MTKKITQSKTKLGAVIAGVAIIGSAIYATYVNAMDGATMTEQILIGAGVILFGLGLRDALDRPLE